MHVAVLPDLERQVERHTRRRMDLPGPCPNQLARRLECRDRERRKRWPACEIGKYRLRDFFHDRSRHRMRTGVGEYDDGDFLGREQSQ
jgi:hypothetical protein